MNENEIEAELAELRETETQIHKELCDVRLRINQLQDMWAKLRARFQPGDVIRLSGVDMTVNEIRASRHIDGAFRYAVHRHKQNGTLGKRTMLIHQTPNLVLVHRPEEASRDGDQ